MSHKNNVSKLAVSVVMCTYNGAAFVEKQLLSILQQTHPPKEILVFDDGSTDNTVSILKSIAESNDTVSVNVNTRNIGYNKNFEQALLNASSELIAISDQDDIWAPEKIATLLLALDEENELIYSGSNQFEDENALSSLLNKNTLYFSGTDVRRIFMNNSVSGHAMMIRRSLLQKSTPFPENVSYDWWLAAVAACNGGVQFVDKVLTFQRQHNNNVTLHGNKFSKNEIKEKIRQETLRTVTAFIKIKNIPNSYKKFADRFVTLLANNKEGHFNLSLFLFIMRYRNLLFNYKGQWFLLYYHLKNSYRRSIK